MFWKNEKKKLNIIQITRYFLLYNVVGYLWYNDNGHSTINWFIWTSFEFFHSFSFNFNFVFSVFCFMLKFLLFSFNRGIGISFKFGIKEKTKFDIDIFDVDTKLKWKIVLSHIDILRFDNNHNTSISRLLVDT